MTEPISKTLCVLLVAVVVCFAPTQAQNAPDKPDTKTEAPKRNPKATAPDKQPSTGPGSSDYAHKSVTVTERGARSEKYWLFLPAEPAPKKSLPVIAFIHGFGALKPANYRAWIDHMTKRGNAVIYPIYQEHTFVPPKDFAKNSAASINDAIEYMKSDECKIKPDTEKFAIAGHSAGGMTTGNLGADWETLKLPEPKALMPVQPGRAFSYNSKAQAKGLIPLSDFANIPEDCLLLSVYGDSDWVVGSWCAKTIFKDATNVKAENKNLVKVVSDDYGKHPIVADHRTPGAPVGTADVLDWYGYWKLFDALTDAAFYGKNRDYALGDTAKQKSLGEWSDGHKVLEMKVTLGKDAATVDPMDGYIPIFKRNGERNPNATPKDDGESKPKEEPKEPEPRSKDDEEEEADF